MLTTRKVFFATFLPYLGDHLFYSTDNVAAVAHGAVLLDTYSLRLEYWNY